MPDIVAIAFVIGGLALLFLGATVSRYAIGVLGMLIGGTGGYLIGPSAAGAVGLEATIGIAVAVLVGILFGAFVAIMLLKTAIAGIAFVVGTYAGWSALAGLLVDGSWIVELAVSLGIGFAAAAVAFVMTRTMLVVLTAFVGAAFASMAVTPGDIVAAQEALHPSPLLFDVAGLAFLALFTLGILVQLGLFKFGYLLKPIGMLPGIRNVRQDRRA